MRNAVRLSLGIAVLALVSGFGCASHRSQAVTMHYVSPQPLASSLLYDRYPGCYRADEMIRDEWPATDSWHQGAEIITYRERTIDWQGGRNWSNDHVSRRAVSRREFQAVR